MRLQSEYEASQHAWVVGQHGWFVGRGGVPVRAEAGRGGGPLVVHGAPVFIGAVGQVAGHTTGHAAAPAPAQQQHEGNTIFGWHRSHLNPTFPPPGNEEYTQEDPEQIGIGPAEAAARGALLHVPIPVPSDEGQRVEGSANKRTYTVLLLLALKLTIM